MPRVLAAAAVRDQANARFHQARNAAEAAARAAEVRAIVERLGEAMPRVLFALQDLAQLEADGFPRAEAYGISHNAARVLIGHIVATMPNAEWDFSHLLTGGKAELPSPTPAAKARWYAFQTDIHGNSVRDETGNALLPVYAG